jgi:protein-tyrosine-phosphatase/N-acetylglutamate synthase-like GNAT family acetyltransferase
MMSAGLRPATPADLPAVAAVLVEAGLPTIGLEGFVDGLVVAERDGVIVGAGGLEPAGEDILLRSLVTAPGERGRGTGQALIARLVTDARTRGARTIWLLTETAAELFPRFGFRRVARALAPAPLQALAEFAHACPASAVALARRAQPLRVLVLCTANAARSQMAEALLAHWGGDLVVAASAGSRPGHGPHPRAVATLAERGIAWEGKRSQGIDAVQGQPWDLVVTVCDAARDACPVLPGATMVHWGLPDPAGVAPEAVAEAFRATADALEARVRALLALPLAVLDPAALQAAARALHAVPTA